LKQRPALRFAGQVTGVEEYVESASIGLLAGRFAAAECHGRTAAPPPETTALGALLNHITRGHLEGAKAAKTFQPMNVNFGLFPEVQVSVRGKMAGRARKTAQSTRALTDINTWLGIDPAQAAE